MQHTGSLYAFGRRRLAILTHISQACLARAHTGNNFACYAYSPLCGYDCKPRPGDLIRPESVIQPNKWYIAWFHEMLDENWNRCLLESIEDGEICEWSNIGIGVFDREMTAKHPEWRWNDAQWDLWDRWKAPDLEDEPYMVLPCRPEFEGDAVTLATRSRFNMTPKVHLRRKFGDWKKVTAEDICQLYRDAVAAGR